MAPCSVRQRASAWSPRWAKVHDRNVDVELGVPLAGRVLQERRGHRAGRVAVLRALRPGPHEQSALDASNGRPSGRQQRVRDRAGLVLQRPGVLIRSALAQPPSVRQQRGVQHDTDLAALTVKSKYGTALWDLARSAARTASSSPAVAYGCATR